MHNPNPSTWRELFQDVRDVPREKLCWWLSDRLDCALTALPLDASIEESDHIAFQDAVTRLSHHEPVQYICGRTPFRSLLLNVTPGVLIPRPETEQLVQIALDDILQPTDRVVDVGTGSGCIALSLKQERPDLYVEATDLSETACDLARKNAARLHLDVKIRQADLLTQEPPSSWDVILSNPPYIAEREKLALPAEVCDFEPEEALFSKEDGVAHIRRLLEQAQIVLKPGGRILLETGETQRSLIEALAEKIGFQIEHRADLAGRDRFRILYR